MKITVYADNKLTPALFAAILSRKGHYEVYVYPKWEQALQRGRELLQQMGGSVQVTRIDR